MVRAVLRKHTVMNAGTTVPNSHARALRLWLLAVAAMIFLTLVVGGATRLTESGLSITEWKPVTGVLPPLSQAGLAGRVQGLSGDPAIPGTQPRHEPRRVQDDLLVGMDAPAAGALDRRRVPAAVPLFPLARLIRAEDLRARLWAIFGGGALLGAVGWWMVASGLAGSGRVSVSQYRLAFHLTLACAIYAAVLWTAQQIAPRPPAEAPPRLRLGALAIAALVLAQIYLGALVAGSDAGLVYNTWPLIDGAFVPASERLWFFTPLWRNLFENTLTVQFDHRMLAYAIWLVGDLARLERLALRPRSARRARRWQAR